MAVRLGERARGFGGGGGRWGRGGEGVAEERVEGKVEVVAAEGAEEGGEVVERVWEGV